MWLLFLILLYSGYFLFEIEAVSLRTPPILTTSHIKVFETDGIGRENEVRLSGDDKVHEALCAERVISRLVRCDSLLDSDFSPDIGGKLYPMSAEYKSSVALGHACPLPAPFMFTNKGRCCVGANPQVWPNFCEHADKIGTNPNFAMWDVGGSVHLPPQPIVSGVYTVGYPDVPATNSKWKPTMGVFLTYFLAGTVWLLVAMYIQDCLSDEAALQHGKNREKLLAEMKANDDHRESSSENESSVGSLSPTHAFVEQGGLAEAGKVSMAFGLLPSLPRGRSTNNSTLNTPRP